jgi:hypothetical protein
MALREGLFVDGHSFGPGDETAIAVIAEPAYLVPQ